MDTDLNFPDLLYYLGLTKLSYQLHLHLDQLDHHLVSHGQLLPHCLLHADRQEHHQYVRHASLYHGHVEGCQTISCIK